MDDKANVAKIVGIQDYMFANIYIYDVPASVPLSHMIPLCPYTKPYIYHQHFQTLLYKIDDVDNFLFVKNVGKTSVFIQTLSQWRHRRIYDIFDMIADEICFFVDVYDYASHMFILCKPTVNYCHYYYYDFVISLSLSLAEYCV